MTPHLEYIETLKNIYFLIFSIGLLFLSLNSILKFINNFGELSSLDFDSISEDFGIEAVDFGVDEFDDFDGIDTTEIPTELETSDLSLSQHSTVENLDLEQLTTGTVQIEDILNQDKKDVVEKEERTPYPKLISMRIMKMSLTAIGAFGLVLLHLEFTPKVVIPVTIFVGIIVSVFNQQLYKFIANQTIYNHRDCNFIGKEARVIIPIPKGGMGKIDIVVLSERHRFMAWSKNKCFIEAESSVRILSKIQNTCIVELI